MKVQGLACGHRTGTAFFNVSLFSNASCLVNGFICPLFRLTLTRGLLRRLCACHGLCVGCRFWLGALLQVVRSH